LAQKQKPKPKSPKEWISEGNRIHRQIHALKGEEGNRKKIAHLRPKRYKAYLEAVKSGASIDDIPFKDAQKYVREHLGTGIANAKPKKQEHSEFRKSMKEVEEFEKTSKQKKLPVPKKTEELVTQISSPKLAREVRAWLNTFSEYKKIKAEIQKMEKEVDAASQALIRYGHTPKIPKREIREMAKELRVKRLTLFDAEGKLDIFLKNKEKPFRDQHSFDPELVKEYRMEHQAFGQKRGAKMARIFTPEEQRVIDRAKRKVRGRNRMETGMKEIILKRANELYKRLDAPSKEEKDSMQEIEKAAINPDIDTVGMIKIAVGEENINTEETGALMVAVAGELLERLETRVAMLDKRRGVEPVKLAHAQTRKKEGEV
jgi:hypothetical protein